MDNTSKVKTVRLKSDSKYQRLFNKDSGTYGMKSGHVILNAGEEIGEHSTDNLEEALVILKGRGQLIINKEEVLNIEDNTVLYVPPETLHNVKNTGGGILEYIFLISNAK